MTAVERIDAEIATLEARIEGLRYARGIVAGDGGEPFTVMPAKKPIPPVAPSRPAEEGRFAAQKLERREHIARLLRDRGPLKLNAIVEALGVAVPTANASLDHPWFRKVDPSNRLSPWTLTDAGRAAAGA